MELQGKVISFLGDSITEGARVENKDNVFVNRLQRMCGLKRANNYGIGGTRIARQYSPTVEKPRHDLDFCGRCLNMDKESDIIVVFGGTNDFGHGDAPFGEFTDRTPDTFYGACHYLFENLIKGYPGATIVVMTPTHRLSEDEPVKGNRRSTEKLSGYVRAIREVAEYYSLPLLDLYAHGGIQPRVDVQREMYMPDGLHPNDAGHGLIAERLAGFLRAL